MKTHTILLAALLGTGMFVPPSGYTENLAAAMRIAQATSAQKPESVLPRAEDVPDWRMDGDVDVYVPDNLYEYINGAAEGYLDYGFRKLATSRYVQKESEDNEITVDVYDMDVPLQGFGMYACERSPENHFIELGGQGHVSETFLGFWQGKFYVKMVFFGRSEQPEKLLLEFAKATAGRIEQNPPQPAFFKIFPGRHRLPNTELVFLKAPLGHAFLSPAYQVSYRGGERPALLLVSLAPDADQAAQRMEKYREHLKNIDASTSFADGFPEGCVRVQDRYTGECVVGQVGRFLVFLVGRADDDKALMAELCETLQRVQQEQPPGASGQ